MNHQDNETIPNPNDPERQARTIGEIYFIANLPGPASFAINYVCYQLLPEGYDPKRNKHCHYNRHYNALNARHSPIRQKRDSCGQQAVRDRLEYRCGHFYTGWAWFDSVYRSLKHADQSMFNLIQLLKWRKKQLEQRATPEITPSQLRQQGTQDEQPPKSPWKYGLRLVALGRYQDAIKHFQSPHISMTAGWRHYGLACVFHKQARFQQAIDHLQRAIHVAGNSKEEALFRRLLGKLYYDEGAIALAYKHSQLAFDQYLSEEAKDLGCTG